MTPQRVAVVIGAASGIGWASAQGLAADGCRVVAADRNTEGAAARASELGAPHTSGYVDNTALGRAGTPEDIAAAVVFVCSPQASWMTGEVVDLNGGAHLRRYPDVLGHVMKLAQAQAQG